MDRFGASSVTQSWVLPLGLPNPTQGLPGPPEIRSLSHLLLCQAQQSRRLVQETPLRLAMPSAAWGPPRQSLLLLLWPMLWLTGARGCLILWLPLNNTGSTSSTMLVRVTRGHD
jgi:hypothetical protein